MVRPALRTVTAGSCETCLYCRRRIVFDPVRPVLHVVCRAALKGRTTRIATAYFHACCYHEAGSPHGAVSARALLSVVER